jgi:hypothetical protein
MSKRFAAESIGTFWLVLGGCGSAVLAVAFPNVEIDLLGVALAFGLTVLTMAFALGHPEAFASGTRISGMSEVRGLSSRGSRMHSGWLPIRGSARRGGDLSGLSWKP